MNRVGFIGLGHMGGPMCAHLVTAGFQVTAFDLDRAALRQAAAAGASPGESAQDCARGAQALITMLPGPAQVEQVLLREGVLECLERGAVAVDMSTSSVAVGRVVLAEAEPRGVEVLDAPVAGQATGARAGTLSIYVGGEAGTLERVRPVLQAMGDPDRIHHVGGHGAGYTVKLLLNLLWFIESAAVGEVLTVGVRAGVKLDKLYAALVASPANSNFLERDVRSVLDEGDYDEAFPMRLVTKDLGLAVELAREAGVPVELTALVERIHGRAREAYGDAAGEISAVRLYEDLAGIKLRFEPG